jgi:hypothetical protein
VSQSLQEMLGIASLILALGLTFNECRKSSYRHDCHMEALKTGADAAKSCP